MNATLISSLILVGLGVCAACILVFVWCRGYLRARVQDLEDQTYLVRHSGRVGPGVDEVFCLPTVGPGVVPGRVEEPVYRPLSVDR